MHRLDLSSYLLVVTACEDPEERLRRLATVEAGIDDLGDRIRRLRRDAIRELRRRGSTLVSIAEVLGVSAERVRQLSE